MKEIDFDPSKMTRATASDIERMYFVLWGKQIILEDEMTHPTTGHTYRVSQQELDRAYLDTLLAMVAEYPENEYWRNLLDDHKSKMETLHDDKWLGPQEPPQDYRIYNKRQADGTYKDLAGFFNPQVADVAEWQDETEATRKTDYPV